MYHVPLRQEEWDVHLINVLRSIPLKEIYGSFTPSYACASIFQVRDFTCKFTVLSESNRPKRNKLNGRDLSGLRIDSVVALVKNFLFI
jgi:hypothetical protein